METVCPHKWNLDVGIGLILRRSAIAILLNLAHLVIFLVRV